MSFTPPFIGRDALLESLLGSSSVKRKVFYSFHFDRDNWRASQIRNIGVVEGNAQATDNDWETIKKSGEKAIQNWIDEQLVGTSCSIVLIGQNTAGRFWIDYEIIKSWNEKKGVFGIHIHHLKDRFGFQSAIGANPFDQVVFGNNNSRLSSVVKVYNPPYNSSTDVYNYIKNNLKLWIEEAITIRSRY